MAVYEKDLELPSGLGNVSIKVSENLSTKFKALQSITGVLDGNITASDGLAVVGGAMTIVPALAPVGLALTFISGLLGTAPKPPEQILSEQITQVSKQVAFVSEQINIVSEQVKQVSQQLKFSTDAIIKTIEKENIGVALLAPQLVQVTDELFIESQNFINLNLQEGLNNLNDYQILTDENLNVLNQKVISDQLDYTNAKNELIKTVLPVITIGKNELEKDLESDKNKIAYLKALQKDIDELTAFDMVSFIDIVILAVKKKWGIT